MRNRNSSIEGIVRIFLFILFCAVTVLACESLRLDIYEAADLVGGEPVTVERGSIKPDGSDDASMANYERWIRSSYFLETKGAKTLKIPITRAGQCYVWQYNDKYRVISRDAMKGSVNLLNTCKFIRFTIRATNTPDHISVLLNGGNGRLAEKKKVQMNSPFDRLVFSVEGDVYTTALLILPPNYSTDGKSVPLVLWDAADGSFRDWEKYAGNPYEGQIDGLYYLRDQGFAVLEIYSWGSNYYKKYPNCGIRSAMPIPTHLATHEKGVDYVLKRYNIDPNNIFHISKSGSGKIALYYAMFKPSFNLKSIYAFAPVFDDLNFIGWSVKDYRMALFDELGLQGTEEEVKNYLEGTPYVFDINYKKTNNLDIDLSNSWQIHEPLGRLFIENNAEKFKVVSVDWLGVDGISLEQSILDTHYYSSIFWDGYNRHYNAEKKVFTFSWDDRNLPASHSNSYTRYDLKRQGSGIPLTVVMSPTDEQTPYWNALEVVKQFQNGGGDATMITLETGGHSGPDLSTSGPNAVLDVTTRLGYYYKHVSIGWYLAVEDIYNYHLETK